MFRETLVSLLCRVYARRLPLLALLTMLGLAGIAHAQTPDPNAPPVVDAAALAQRILDAAQHHAWSLLVALVLSGVFAILWRQGKAVAAWTGNPKIVAFVGSDRFGVLMLLLTSACGAVVTALVAGQQVSVPLLVMALGVGLKAIGSFVGLRKLLGLSSDPAPTVVPLPVK